MDGHRSTLIFGKSFCLNVKVKAGPFASVLTSTAGESITESG